MNIKNKLFATLIMSLLAFGGGGYYLYHLFTTSEETGKWAEFQYYQPDIVAPVKLDSRATSKAKKLNDVDNTILSGLNEATTPSSSGITNNNSYSSFSSGTSNYAYSSRSRETTSTDMSYGGSGNLLAYSSTSSGRTSDTKDVAGSTTSVSSSLSTSTTGPMAVPFNTNNYPSQALVDPGGDPDQSTRIPVGEGWWVLLLMAGGYLAFRRGKR